MIILDIFYLVREGRMTLHTGFTEGLPSEWFDVIKGYTPLCGKETHGYTHFTRIGWEANKDEIRKIFEENKHKRDEGEWADFENLAEEHLKAVSKGLAKRIKKMEQDLRELKDKQKLYSVKAC